MSFKVSGQGHSANKILKLKVCINHVSQTDDFYLDDKFIYKGLCTSILLNIISGHDFKFVAWVILFQQISCYWSAVILHEIYTILDYACNINSK